MPLLDINSWFDGFKQRAIRLAEIIPPGTLAKSTFDPDRLNAYDRQTYVPFEGEYLGVIPEYPFPIHLVATATKQEFYNSGDHLALFWQGRWQSVDEIVGESNSHRG